MAKLQDNSVDISAKPLSEKRSDRRVVHNASYGSAYSPSMPCDEPTFYRARDRTPRKTEATKNNLSIGTQTLGTQTLGTQTLRAQTARYEYEPEPSVSFPRESSDTGVLDTGASAFRYILALFVSSRIVLSIIGVVASATLPKGYGKQTVWSSWPWLDIWGVWDSLWYMDIAQSGYSIAPKLMDYPEQTNLAFFPLYPLLMRFFSYFTGGDLFIAGLLVSNGCLILSAYLLYRLVAIQWGDVIARRSVKYLFLFPVSFILSGIFTESLYLCLSLLCFYLAKQRRWWLAGMCGALLSATRSLGLLIAIPLLFEYLSSVSFKLSKIRANVLFAALIPVGLLAFSYHNYQVSGDFLFFKTNQAAWDRAFTDPVTAFVQALSAGISEPSYKKLLECAFFAGAVGLLGRFRKQLPTSYLLLAAYSLLIPLSAGIASMPRFTLPVFPLFVALALLSQKRFGQGRWNIWLTLSLGLLQGALMVLWCTGQGLVI